MSSGATHSPRCPTLRFAGGDPNDTDLACRVPLGHTARPIGSIISLLGLTLRVPDHTTLSVCSATLARPQPQLNNTDKGDSAQFLNLLVDGTGLKL
jgi:hypothetical protein